MNLGIESETLEFKKSTAELEKAVNNIASMLNKHGHGTVYFGVSPDGNVTGQLISASTLNDIASKIKDTIKPMIYPEIKKEEFDGQTVIRVDFSGTEKPYSSNGRYYKRVFDRTEEMTPDELKQMMASTDHSSYWENNTTRYGLEVLDSNALKNFYEKAISCGRLDPMSQYDEAELLTGLGLYEDGKLTNAGYYLFSNKKPITLKIGVYVSDERINFSDIQRIEDNIYNLIAKSYSYIKEHINWRVQIGDGTSRVEIPEIPIEAIREIVVNSFVHANYRGMSENEIAITPTQLEIYNPGEFPENLTPEMFVKERIKSMPRNKVISNTLYKSKDVEIFGSGFKKVFTYCEKYGTTTKSFSGNGGFFFVFYRNSAKQSSITTKQKKISTVEAIYELLKEDPTQTREVLAQKIGKNMRTIQRAIDKLANDKRIIRIGSNKTGYWEIIK